MWNIVKGIFSWLSMTILGMMGGQGKIGGKGTRRFGLPAVAVMTDASVNGFRWKNLVFLLFIPILAMGYGVDSQIGALCLHIEWLIRAVYASLLSLPFLFFGMRRWLVALAALILAFQIQAGSVGHVSWFGDVLIEDIFRYGTLSALVLFNIFKKEK